MEARLAAPIETPPNPEVLLPIDVSVAITPGIPRRSRAIRSAIVVVAASEVPSGARTAT